MPYEEDRAFYIISGIAAVGVLCLGVALLVVAWSVRAQLVTSWLLIVFQIFIFVLLSAAVILVVYQGVQQLIDAATGLAKEHPAVARAAKVHRPAIGAVFVLAASVLPSAGAPFFGDNVFLATGISVVMIVLFFCASGYMVDKRPWGRRFGFMLWYTSAILLPVTIGIYHHWHITQMARTAGINSPARISLFVAVSLAILILPRWTPGAAG